MNADAPMTRVIGFDHVNLKTHDIDRSIGFYVDVLGLPLVRVERDEGGAITFASVRAGMFLVDLHPSDDEWTDVQTGLNHLAMLVEPLDLAALAGRLRERGVTIVKGPVRRQGAFGYGQALYITDPDGHGIEIKHHELPRIER